MNMSPGPFPRYRLYTRAGSYLSLLADALLGRATRGPGIAELERAICARFGVAHAVCMPQARVGIHLVLKALIRPGQGVVMSPYTIADVVNMVIAAGGRPRFAELEPNTCNADPADVERLIDSDTGAVLITHLHGLADHPAEIREICKSRGVPLVEDAAQAFGAVAGGRRAGTIGDAGIYSFGMYKNINSWYGGMVVTDDPGLAASVRDRVDRYTAAALKTTLKRMRKGLLTDVLTSPALFRRLTFRVFRHGMLHDVGWINRRVNTELDLGRRDEFPERYRARYTPSQARIALAQLDRIDEDSRARIRKAAIYHEGLGDVPGLVLPPAIDGMSHIYTYFPVQVPDRVAALKWMMRHGRDCAAQHLKNCADLPGFAEFHRDLPIARRTAESVILLPTYPRYPDSEVRRNVETLRAYMEARRGAGAPALAGSIA